MKKVTYSYSISIVVVASITLMFSGCGEDEVSINTLIDSPDDYIGDRIRVTGWLFSIDKNRLEAYLGPKSSPGGISCFFPVNEPLPPYLGYGDMITLSGIVRVAGHETELIECRIID